MPVASSLEVGVPPERLARMDVGNVDLHEGDADCGKRIAQRDTGVGERRRVDQDEIHGLTRRLLDAFHEFGLRVALKGDERRSLCLRLGGET